MDDIEVEDVCDVFVVLHVSEVEPVFCNVEDDEDVVVDFSTNVVKKEVVIKVFRLVDYRVNVEVENLNCILRVRESKKLYNNKFVFYIGCHILCCYYTVIFFLFYNPYRLFF